MCRRRFKGAADAIREKFRVMWDGRSFLLRASSSEWNKLGNVEMRIWEELEFVSILFLRSRLNDGFNKSSSKQQCHDSSWFPLEVLSMIIYEAIENLFRNVIDCRDAFARRLNEAGGGCHSSRKNTFLLICAMKRHKLMWLFTFARKRLWRRGLNEWRAGENR